MEKIVQWVKASMKAVEGKNPECPRCNERQIDFQYVGYPETRLGYLVVWCKACNHGAHISRVKVPEGIDMLPMESSDEVLRDRIPEYKTIEGG